MVLSISALWAYQTDTWQAVSDFISAIMVAILMVWLTPIRLASPGTPCGWTICLHLQRLYRQMDRMVPDDVPYEVERAEDDVNNILMDMVKVGESHGLHFPREFALLLKQFLYFDRYVHILAPEMDVFMDERLTMLH